jgi:stage II sporulation protein D
MWVRVLVLVGLLMLSWGLAQPRNPSVLTIRVLLAQQNKFSILMPANHAALYADGTTLSSSATPLEWRFSVQNGDIGIETAEGVFDTGKERLVLQSDYFQFSGKLYRGMAVLVVREGQIMLLNFLDVEEYVRGVIPLEMPTSWQEEALKAQAVIARTYAIANINTRADYDLCASERCQVYGGASAETPRGDAAAASTRGLILSYQNRPARTYFHAESGGFTASSREIWGSDLPYLTARPDPGGVSSPNPWRITVSQQTAQSVISRFVTVGTFKSIRVVDRTESNRPVAIEIVGSAATARVTGTNVYALSRQLGAKSSLIDFVSSNPLVIEGYGNGHGVGLSQYGARYFAAQGYSYTQILGYYYPGVGIGAYSVQ